MLPKIHLVNDHTGGQHLVRAFTTAGARKHVAEKLGQKITARIPSQDELLAARDAGIGIESAITEKESG
ncbi:MAG TPA: hypothetical protein VFZ38_17885 [Vicinamibacterales bacterium]